MLAVAVCGVLAVWFLASAIAQIRLAGPLRVRRHDWFGFLPRWNFFAPHPIIGDVVVEYRAGAETDRWTRLSVPAHRWFDTLWPRHRRSRKALVDSANQTLAVYHRYPDEPGDVALSIPYLMLLGRASREIREVGGSAVQFRIRAISYSERGPSSRVAFRSAIHAVRVRATPAEVRR